MPTALPECPCLASELVQNVFIVSPAGDAAGFAPQQVSTDHTAIERFLSANPSVTALVVDLGSNAYYGSRVIGALTNLATSAKTRGLRVALVNASEETRAVLRVMAVDSMFEHFDSREKAVSVLARNMAIVRLKRLVPAAAIVAAIALAAGIVLFTFPALNFLKPEPTTLGLLYRDIKELEQEYQSGLAQFNRNNTDAVIRFRNTYRGRLEDLANSLDGYEKSGDRDETPAQKAGSLMHAALTEDFSEVVQQLLNTDAPASRRFHEKLTQAHTILADPRGIQQ